MNYDGIVLDTPIRHKSLLERRNDFGEDKFESIGQQLEDNLIGDIAKACRYEMIHIMNSTLFRNQGDQVMILLTGQVFV